MVALRFLVPSVGVQIPVSLPLLGRSVYYGASFFFEKYSATWPFNLLKDLLSYWRLSWKYSTVLRVVDFLFAPVTARHCLSSAISILRSL